jgi:hypothetical protein
MMTNRRGAAVGHDLEHLAISNSGFVFEPRSGATFTVNDTGRMLLEGLRDGSPLDGLVDSLVDVFDCTGADLRRDVLEYVRQLREARLLPTDFELE